MYSTAIEPIGSSPQPLFTCDATAFSTSKHDAGGTHEAAKKLVAAGLSIIPVRPDGSKAPVIAWKAYQSVLASQQDLESWFLNGIGHGIAIVAGNISGGLEIVDFDDTELFPFWRDLVELHYPGLADRLVIVKTPSEGHHVYYRCETVEGNQKLAQREQEPKGVKTLIETRGEGGYVLAPPSPPQCHPANRLYCLIQGDLTNIPTITPDERAALLGAGRSFNEYVRPERVLRTKKDPIYASRKREGVRPGDEFNAQADWESLLTSHGWTRAGDRGAVGLWRRPGKDDQGISATTNHGDSNLLYVFSTNCDPFEPDRAYDLFAAYTLLEHAGDFKAAAQALAAQGYGALARELGEQPKQQSLTGVSNAERLVRLHGTDLRYCHAWRRWLIWDGQRWKEDETEVIKLRAKDTVRSIYGEAPEVTDSEVRKAMVKWAMQSESENRIREMISLASAERGIPVTPDELDSDPWLLNVKNGTIDLKTGTLQPHRREDLITKLAPVVYDPNATCPAFEDYLNKIMEGKSDLISFLRRAVGYSLTGLTREQVMFICYGVGANGKSTLLELLLDLLGDYAMQTATDTLMVKRGSSIPNDIARLKGARLVTAVETDEGRRLSESLVKQLTGGDRISARFMRAEWFDFKPSFKIWLATNHKPVIRGTDNAIWRRIRLVPFMVTIPEPEQDKTLPQKLRAEMPGILRWAVEGCLDWQCNRLGVPEDVKRATEGYRAEMDVIGYWLGECCLLGSSAKVKKADAYNSYKSWCEENGEYVINQRVFAQHLKERGITEGKSDSARLWKGIGLLKEE